MRSILLALAVCALSSPALAASSEWATVEGGSVRVVTEGTPDSKGVLRGALEVRLNPGWKTYWRDPGESGIPPVVNVLEPSGEAKVEIGFPTPQRFEDEYSVWAGYNTPTALALTFALPASAAQDDLDVSVFLGICEVICIPVQADFGIDLTDTSNAALDHKVVAETFAALPNPATADFGATLTEVGDDRIMIETRYPDSTAEEPTLFVASTENWAFDVPRPVKGAEGVAFAVPVLLAPDAGAPADIIHYTLVAGEQAVAGTLEITR